MILDAIIKKKETTLEGELIRMLPREQGKIAKQMKLYGLLFVIGETKKTSPSKGATVEDFNATCFANARDEAGINAISILTERNPFQGGLENIEVARFVSDLPILRKDFIMDVREIVQTKRISANMMLLIMAILDDIVLREFYQLARFLNLEYIVKVHNEKELERVSQLQPEVIGINSRDLYIFAIPLETTKRLAFRIPTDISIVSEGGVLTHKDMGYVRKAGANATLIGESFMRCSNIRTHLQELECGNCKAIRY